MVSKIFFVQALLAIVTGQSLEGMSDAPNYVDMAASAGLAQPTSRWNIQGAQNGSAHRAAALMDTSTAVVKETSPMGVVSPAASTPNGLNVNNLMHDGAEGDIRGAQPRNNMVYFGIGRHGLKLGTDCDGSDGCGCGGCGGSEKAPARANDCEQRHPVRHESNCDHSYDRPMRVPNAGTDCHHGYQNSHQGYEPPVYQPCRNPPGYSGEAGGRYQPKYREYSSVQPYVKVTPSLSVVTVTRTEVETSTATSLDVSTSWRTRTTTEELFSTQTHLMYPERTHTFEERHTVYEYPASTIDADRVRHAGPTNAAAAPYGGGRYYNPEFGHMKY